MALITDCLKKEEFEWTKAAAKAFREIKERMTEAPVMRLSDFTEVLKITCDAKCWDRWCFELGKASHCLF